MKNTISKAAMLSILHALEHKAVVENYYTAHIDAKDVFAVLRNHCEEPVSDGDLAYYGF